ncbi:hypothetical protein ACQP10_34785 [Streptosporangium sandarakinum]|uniref:hypothetical protein n=1 Tax=Streptosporangium sandarakinum TaxID=1260955 RepID=UPI003D8B246D
MMMLLRKLTWPLSIFSRRNRLSSLAPQISTKAELLNMTLVRLGVFQTYIQHADAKAGTLVAIHAGTAALAAGNVDTATALWKAGVAPGVVGVALLACFACGFLIAGHHLIAAIRPRLKEPAGSNRFGLAGYAPGATEAQQRQDDLEEQAREAERLINVLADVARAKYARITRAVPWMVLMFVTTVTWMALGAFFP